MRATLDYDEFDIKKRHDDEVWRLRVQIRWLAFLLLLNMLVSVLIICRQNGWL